MSSLSCYLEAKTSLVVSLLATCMDERFSVSSLVRSVWLRFVHQSFVMFQLTGQDFVDPCHVKGLTLLTKILVWLKNFELVEQKNF